MDFWNDQATDMSWKVLLELRKELEFVLIGGWACYLLTKAVKSKDIDIIVGFEVLDEMRKKHGMKKNPHLKKYEAVIKGISVDIYVPYYSEFPVPPEDVMKECISIEGFRVPKPEMLLTLKQRAEMDRSASTKGQKDRVDILNLLMRAGVDKKTYLSLLEKYNLQDFRQNLLGIIKGAGKEFHYLGIEDPRKIKLLKKDMAKGF